MDLNQRDENIPPNSVTSRGATSGTPGGETPEDPSRGAPGGVVPPAADRQPQYAGVYTVFPPNESRRNENMRIAQREEEELQRWREANRVPAVHMTPETLGGSATLSGARERQQTDSRCSKLQKRLKKEELDRKRRQEEDEENQKMKDKQREKAERLEEKKRQEEQRRRELLSQDHARTNDSFLRRYDRPASGPLASSSAAHTSSRGDAVESKQREEWKGRDVQQQHRRVNRAFLDNLQGRPGASERETKEEGVRESPFSAPEYFGHQPSNTPGQQLPDQSFPDWIEDADPEFDRALVKLMNSFPDYNRAFLEDILDQCNSDYEQAFTLLNIR